MSGEVGHESFLWEDVQPWIFPENSGGGGGGNEEKSARKKILDSTTTSNNRQQNEIGGEVVGVKKRSGVSKTTNGKGSEGGGDKVVSEGGESDHEIHIWTERERRKKMRNMFSTLHALLPQLPPKADKSTIVDEAVSYIRTLQQTLQKLQKQKLERLHGMTTINYDPSSSSMIMNPQKLTMETREAFLANQGSSTNLAVVGASSFSVPRFPGPAIFQSWTSPNVTINVCREDAHFSICSTKKFGLFLAICFVLEKHELEVVSAHVSSDNCRSMYMIQAHANAADQFPEAFPIEEIYKQAAGEIMLWVNS